MTTTPKFTTRIDIVVVAISDLALTGKKSADVSIDSAVQVLLSDQVLGKTARDLQYPGRSSGLLDDMNISPLINSRILRIYVSSETRGQAQNAATTLAKNFLASRQKALEDAQAARSGAIKAQLDSISVSLAQISNSIALHDTSSAETAKALTIQRGDLQTELTALSVNKPEAGYISHAPELPATSARAGATVYAGSSLAIGLLLGAATASLRDRRKRNSGRRLHKHAVAPLSVRKKQLA
jgi:hypothetical protein